MNIEKLFNYSLDELYECPVEITQETVPCKITKPGLYKIKGKISSENPAIIIQNAGNVILEGNFRSEIRSSNPVIIYSTDTVTIKNMSLSGDICISGIDIDKLNIQNTSIKSYKTAGIVLENVKDIKIKNLVINTNTGINAIIIDNSNDVMIEDLKSNIPIDVKITKSNNVEIFDSKTLDIYFKNVEIIKLIDVKTRNETIEKFKLLNYTGKNKNKIIMV